MTIADLRRELRNDSTERLLEMLTVVDSHPDPLNRVVQAAICDELSDRFDVAEVMMAWTEDMETTLSYAETLVRAIETYISSRTHHPAGGSR